MIKQIFVSALKNFQTFFVAWVIIIVFNQLFIFGACFAPYCLMAALPHTFVIALLINYFILTDDSNSLDNSTHTTKEILDESKFTQPKIEIQDDEFEETQVPYCPKCGSKMVLRTAKNGQHSGNKFWGCSQYPQCKGLLNI